MYILCSDCVMEDRARSHGAFYSLEDLESELWIRIGIRMGAHRPAVYSNAIEQIQALDPNTSVSFSGDEDGSTWYHVYRADFNNPHDTIHVVAIKDINNTGYVDYYYVGPDPDEAEQAVPNCYDIDGEPIYNPLMFVVDCGASNA